MRRVALLGLILCLSGCGYNSWSNVPFTAGNNPNRPAADSENVQRVLGSRTDVPALNPEPGDIWPGPLPPPPTLGDMEKSNSQPATGSSLSRGGYPPSVPETPSQGSSVPPPAPQAATPPKRKTPPSHYAAPSVPPPNSQNAGKVLLTPSGPATTSGGTPGYSTAIQPGGGQSIVVPNGNGTSTVIHADGRIETIPTPK